MRSCLLQPILMRAAIISRHWPHERLLLLELLASPKKGMIGHIRSRMALQEVSIRLLGVFVVLDFNCVFVQGSSLLKVLLLLLLWHKHFVLTACPLRLRHCVVLVHSSAICESMQQIAEALTKAQQCLGKSK